MLTDLFENDTSFNFPGYLTIPQAEKQAVALETTEEKATSKKLAKEEVARLAVVAKEEDEIAAEKLAEEEAMTEILFSITHPRVWMVF